MCDVLGLDGPALAHLQATLAQSILFSCESCFGLLFLGCACADPKSSVHIPNVGEIIPNPWTHRSVSTVKKEPLIAGPVSPSEEAVVTTLKGPAPDRTPRHRAGTGLGGA